MMDFEFPANPGTRTILSRRAAVSPGPDPGTRRPRQFTDPTAALRFCAASGRYLHPVLPRVPRGCPSGLFNAQSILRSNNLEFPSILRQEQDLNRL